MLACLREIAFGESCSCVLFCTYCCVSKKTSNTIYQYCVKRHGFLFSKHTETDKRRMHLSCSKHTEKDVFFSCVWDFNSIVYINAAVMVAVLVAGTACASDGVGAKTVCTCHC